VLLYGFLIGRLTLRPYSNRHSRKTFTQPQLFACLVLKEFLQLDYHKLSMLLHDIPELAAAIGLTKTPRRCVPARTGASAASYYCERSHSTS
jgi:hypothetical protein